jgi:putative oxidoreductase
MAIFSKLGNYKNFGLLIIRAGLGIMFVWHGYPKLLGGEKTWVQVGGATRYVGIHFLPVIWGLAAALVETIGGIFLVIGYSFRLVCLLLLINLLVAAAMELKTGAGLMGAAHAIEDAVVFAGLIFVGPGKYSVDKK